MKRFIILLMMTISLSAYKRECYVNYDPETMRAPFYGRPSTYIFETTDQTTGLFVFPEPDYYVKPPCGRPIGKCGKKQRPCLRKIYRRCRRRKGLPVPMDDATLAKLNGTAVTTCFVQLSKIDTDQLYEDLLRFDPQTYLDDLEFFQNSLVGTVAEEVTIMKKMDNPNARAQVYDILDLLNLYTS